MLLISWIPLSRIESDFLFEIVESRGILLPFSPTGRVLFSRVRHFYRRSKSLEKNTEEAVCGDISSN